MTHDPGSLEATDPRQLLATLRPQDYGNAAPQKIINPVVEPLWTGVRALAAVAGGQVVLVDTEGDSVEGIEAIAESLAEGAQADSLVIDGFLTKETAHVGPGIAWPDEMPTMGRLVGLRHNRAVDTLKLKEDALGAHTFAPDDAISFVATDLLWLDDTSLLDIPLLERRRLLESALLESDVVRRGAYVRPPIETWVSSWRSLGFAGLTYKAANSRYLPGQPNPEWVITGMPRR
ncbi:MAG: hypothetical protein ABI562_08060 [Chloroflexota bacterium]